MAVNRFLYMDQGSTFTANVIVYDDDGNLFDLSNYAARSKFRKHYSSTNSYSFTTSINVNNAIVTLEMNAATTANVTDGRYIYDVEVYDANTNIVFRVLEGILTVTPGATW